MIFAVPTKELSPEVARQAIEDACRATNARLEADHHALRCATRADLHDLVRLGYDSGDGNKLTSLKDQEERLSRDFDSFQIVVLTGKMGNVMGFALTYWAYSTWDGRYLYINTVKAPSSDLESSILYTLAEAATKLEGQRLVWQHLSDKLLLYSSLGAETLEDPETPLSRWLTLRMDPLAMDKFLASRSIAPPEALSEPLTPEIMNQSIERALKAANEVSANMKLCLVSEADLHHVERLVDGLAVYEKEVDVIHVHKDHYRVDGFSDGQTLPLFKCILLEDVATKHYCGMAFFYFGYDVSEGRFLYLEDLFIEEKFRGNGGGALLMATLASTAKALGCSGGFRWQALEWNTPALNFYDKLGAKVLDGLLTTRFNGPALLKFVKDRGDEH